MEDDEKCPICGLRGHDKSQHIKPVTPASPSGGAYRDASGGRRRAYIEIHGEAQFLPRALEEIRRDFPADAAFQCLPTHYDGRLEQIRIGHSTRVRQQLMVTLVIVEYAS